MAQAQRNHEASGGTSYSTPISVSRSSGDSDAETVMRDVTSRVREGERNSGGSSTTTLDRSDLPPSRLTDPDSPYQGVRASSDSSTTLTNYPTTVTPATPVILEAEVPGFTLEPTGGRITPDVGAFVLDVETPKQPQATLADLVSDTPKPAVMVTSNHVPSQSNDDYPTTQTLDSVAKTIAHTVATGIRERESGSSGNRNDSFSITPQGKLQTQNTGFEIDPKKPTHVAPSLGDLVSGSKPPEAAVIASYVPSTNSGDYAQFTEWNKPTRPEPVDETGASSDSFSINPTGDKLDVSDRTFALDVPSLPTPGRDDFEMVSLLKPVTQAGSFPSLDPGDYREPIEFQGPKPRVDTQAQSVLTQVRQARMDHDLEHALANADADLDFTITPTGSPFAAQPPGNFYIETSPDGRDALQEWYQRAPAGLIVNGTTVHVAERLDTIANLAPGGMIGKFAAKVAIADGIGRGLFPLAKQGTDQVFIAAGEEIQDPLPLTTNYDGAYGARGFFDIAPGGISAAASLATSPVVTGLLSTAKAGALTTLVVPTSTAAVVGAGAYVAADFLLPQETQERLLNDGAEAVSDKFLAPRAGASLADSLSEQYNLGPSVNDLPVSNPGVLELYSQQEAGLFM